ncbi:23S rRNA (pseudouridine(1915)-N(3))-methyltransferase RlmH [Patescibacteria group bacterium]|nr:MAG: 23S rRNA (pseudouridine(1915)-N(3))-methyltransferase RlmH [Patescibacteria group bacterium]
MKLLFIAVGKKHDGLVENGVAEFTARIGHYAPIEWKIIPASNAKEEAEKILKSVDQAETLIALDEKGKGLTTLALAEYIEKNMSAGAKRLVFVIGGAYGLDQTVRDRAQLIWSLSPLTFPHQLVRLILSEQVYRAFTVIKGEKYHHEG